MLLLILLGFSQSRQKPDEAIVSASADRLTGIPTVTSSRQWTPIFQDFDGVSMALVPPGCFTMGSNTGDSDEAPTTHICFDKPFWIDKTDVTQAQFKQLGGKAALKTTFAGDLRPVETITWLEARDFCAKRGMRLPTEAEWEYAVRGPDDLIYPWGNTWDGSKAVWNRPASEGTANVGSIPAGASWVGALDMSGNVWQWVSTIFKAYPYSNDDGRENSTDMSSPRALRGGSWYYDDPDVLRASSRNWFGVPNTSNDDGFRCAQS